MQKDYLRWIILSAVLFLSLWRYIGRMNWINKYDDYYYHYINQYPSLETINKVQDMSMPN